MSCCMIFFVGLASDSCSVSSIFFLMSSKLDLTAVFPETSDAKIFFFFSYFLVDLMLRFFKYFVMRLMHTSQFWISTLRVHYGLSSIFQNTNCTESGMSKFRTIHSRVQRVATEISFAMFFSFVSGSKMKKEFSHTKSCLSW